MYLANVGIDTTYRPPAASGGSTYDGRQIQRDSQQPYLHSSHNTYLANLANQRTANQANSPTQTKTQVQTSPQTSNGDVFEQIQNDTRVGKYQDFFNAPTNNIPHFIEDIDGTGVIPPAVQALLDKYGPMGMTAVYQEGGGEGTPSGEGGYIDPQATKRGWNLIGDETQYQQKMPQSLFGEYRNLRSLSSDDRNNVLDPRYVYFDPNYGWVTHRKNYDHTADKSWFMRNAKTIVPTLATLGLGVAGVPSLVTGAIGAGRGMVDVLGGKAPWESLLPTLIGMGFSLSGANEFLGKLAPYIRSGVNYGVGQAVRRD